MPRVSRSRSVSSLSSISIPPCSIFEEADEASPSSASSWDSDYDWQVNPPDQIARVYSSVGRSLRQLFRFMVPFLPPRVNFVPGTFADWRLVCNITISLFWRQLLRNPLHARIHHALRYVWSRGHARKIPHRTFTIYLWVLADAIYWDCVLVLTLLGILCAYALQLGLEVAFGVLWVFTFFMLGYMVVTVGVGCLCASSLVGTTVYCGNTLNDLGNRRLICLLCHQ